MHWSYDQLLGLPQHVYEILIEELNREATANGLNRNL